jgi:hypothetical protein
MIRVMVYILIFAWLIRYSKKKIYKEWQEGSASRDSAKLLEQTYATMLRRHELQKKIEDQTYLNLLEQAPVEIQNEELERWSKMGE